MIHTLPLARITVHEAGGCHVWTGSMHEWARANEYLAADVAAMAEDLRRGEAFLVGGGAAPAFLVSAVERESAC